jgi:chromosome segregation protein
VLVAGGSPGDDPGPLPAGTRPLAECISSDVPGLMATLTRLLRNTVLADQTWEAAAGLAGAHPHLVVVTPRGERFDGRGAWRSGGSGAATQAAVEEAAARAGEAEEARRVAEERLEEARAQLEEARRWESAGERALESHRARHAALASARERAEAELASAREEQAAVAAQAEALAAQHASETARRAELEEQLPALDAAAAAERDNEFQRRAKVEELAREEASVAAARRDLDRRLAMATERRNGLQRRLAEVEASLIRTGQARAEAEQRRAALAVRLKGYQAVQRVLEDRLVTLRAFHERLKGQRRARSEAAREAAERLDGLRRDLAAAERAASEAREQRARVEVEEAEVRTRLATTIEALRRDLECEPEVAYEAPEPPVPEGTTLLARATELERELRRMGPINPLALEEYASLKERHELLESQVDDVRSARRELTEVIRTVDEEIVNRFAAAYADTEAHFSRLIETLFPGGSGRLRLTDPEDLLNTGIEIEARPSGKNVRRLSLLSGGERSLTAFAFLFAVFRALPSPFYLLDEVEAALDDVNLCRFIDLIQSFRDEAQLLVVSHQKRTMEAADSLYGVSMPPGGSSVVVTQRVPSSVTIGSN